jgi:hypothetical protein
MPLEKDGNDSRSCVCPCKDTSTFEIQQVAIYMPDSFHLDVNDSLLVDDINSPRVGILMVDSAREVAVVGNDEIKPGWRMKATLSIDHRVSDGANIIHFRASRPVHVSAGKIPEEALRLLV